MALQSNVLAGNFLTCSWRFCRYSRAFLLTVHSGAQTHKSSHCKQTSQHCKQKIKCKQKTIVRTKAPKLSCKQTRSTISRRLPIIRKSCILLLKWPQRRGFVVWGLWDEKSWFAQCNRFGGACGMTSSDFLVCRHHWISTNVVNSLEPSLGRLSHKGRQKNVDAFLCSLSETGWIWFRGVRLQTPNSVSFFALTEFRGENSVTPSQPNICVTKRTHRVFRRTHQACPQTQWGSVSSLVGGGPRSDLGFPRPDTRSISGWFFAIRYAIGIVILSLCPNYLVQKWASGLF